MKYHEILQRITDKIEEEFKKEGADILLEEVRVNLPYRSNGHDIQLSFKVIENAKNKLST